MLFILVTRPLNTDTQALNAPQTLSLAVYNSQLCLNSDNPLPRHRSSLPSNESTFQIANNTRLPSKTSSKFIILIAWRALHFTSVSTQRRVRTGWPAVMRLAAIQQPCIWPSNREEPTPCSASHRQRRLSSSSCSRCSRSLPTIVA